MKTPIDIISFVKFLMRLDGKLILKENRSLMETFESNRNKLVCYNHEDADSTTICGVSLHTVNEWAHRVIGPSTTYTAEGLTDLSFYSWMEVIKTMFWKPLHCAEFYERPHLALAVADYGFCCGVASAAKCLQEVLNGINAVNGSFSIRRPDAEGVLHNVRICIDEDGVIGRKTLTAIQKVLRHATAEREAVQRICERRSNDIISRMECGDISRKAGDNMLNRIDIIVGTPRWAL